MISEHRLDILVELRKIVEELQKNIELLEAEIEDRDD
jgi:hypothetical protein